MSESINGQNKTLNNVMTLGYIYLFARIAISVYNNVIVNSIFKPNHFSEYHIAFYGSIVGLIFLLIIFPFKTKLFGEAKIKDVGFLPLLLASFFGVAMYTIFYNAAGQRIGSGRTAILYYIYPIFLYIIGSIVIDKNVKKAFNPKVLTGIFVCLAGVVFTSIQKLSSGNNDVTGYIYVLLSAACMIIFSIIAKKNKIPTYWFLFIGQILGIIIAVGKFWFDMLKTGSSSFALPTPNLTVLLALITVGIFCNVTREFFRIKSVEYLPISQITTWNYFSPLATSVGSVIFTSEVFTWQGLVGYALIIGGNVIANWKLNKKLKA